MQLTAFTNRLRMTRSSFIMGMGMPFRFPALLVGGLLALAMAASPLHAQNVQTTGQIRGLVTDNTGEPVAGAMVTATNTGT